MNIENAHKAMLLLDRISKERFNMSCWIGTLPDEERWGFTEDDKEDVICKTPACFAGTLLLAGELTCYAEEDGYAIETQVFPFGIEVYKYQHHDPDMEDIINDEDYLRWTRQFLDITYRSTRLLCGATGHYDEGILYYNAQGRMPLNYITPTDVQKALLILIKNDGDFDGEVISSITDEKLQAYMDKHVRINLNGPRNITHHVESLLDVTRRFLK